MQILGLEHVYKNKNTVEDEKHRNLKTKVLIKEKIKQSQIKIKIRRLKLRKIKPLQNKEDFCSMEIEYFMEEKSRFITLVS